MNRSRPAGSRYRQIRLTCTEQDRGHLDYRISVKPLNESWKMHHTVLVGSVQSPVSTDTLSGVIAALVQILSSHVPDE